jgi:hypothetical protein
VVPTELGKIGGLICWENYMPLARTALYTQGVELYLAPTADSRESWQATIRHIALEGRCHVLACNQFVRKTDYPADLDADSRRELAAADDPLCRGGSAIVGPLGDYLAGPLWDEAGILYAHIDPGAVTEARFDFDAVGHYNRPDLFHLSVNPVAEEAFPTWDEVEMLDELIFGGGFLGGPPGPPEFPFQSSDADPMFPMFPAEWSEKKPPSNWQPAKPVKRKRGR